MSPSRNKTATIHRISYAVFQLEESRGHLRWKVQELARKAKLSRSLVYEYLGSTKKQILVSALRDFLSEFYGFDSFDAKVPFEQSIKNARERMIKLPEAVLFYLKWRSRDSWLRPEFIAVETRFKNQLSKGHPHLNETQILVVYAMIHGLVTAPFLTSSQAEEVSREYMRGSKKDST